MQERSLGNKNGRISFSLDLSHTENQGFLLLSPFPSPLFRREAPQAVQPGAEEGALLLLPACLSIVSLEKLNSYSDI